MKNGKNTVKAQKKGKLAARLVCIALVLVTLVTSLSFTVSASTTEIDTYGAATPLSATNLSGSDFYRLLYLNNTAFTGDVIHDFEKTGVEITDVSHNAQFSQALKNANLGLLAMGLFKKAGLSGIVAPLKFLVTKTGVYNVNSQTAEMLNQLGEDLGEVYNALAQDLENQTSVINQKLGEQSSYLANKIDAQTAKQDIDKFLGDKFGGKGYNGWKADLYGYYKQIFTYNDKGASEDSMRLAYNDLYKTAIHLDDLYDALTGSNCASAEPIQEIMYKYYLLRAANGESVDLEAATEFCLDFTNDLYTTYLLAKTSLSICYHYQISSLRKQYGDKYDTSYYMLTQSEGVSYEKEIAPFVLAGEKDVDAITVSILRFYSKVLGVPETYTHKTAGGRINPVVYTQLTSEKMAEGYEIKHDVVDTYKYAILNNRVEAGDTLYMNTLPLALTSGLSVNLDFVSSDTSKATVTEDGVVTVKENGDFTIHMVFGNKAIYSVPFTSEGNFSDGRGTEYSPYIIGTSEDLKTFANNSEYWKAHYYFELSDEYGTSTFLISDPNQSQIGTNDDPYKGHFDGNGLTIEVARDSDKKSLYKKSLFGVNEGTIRDIFLSRFTFSDSDYATKTSPVVMAAGVLCNVNCGTIRDVFVNDSILFVNHQSTDADLYIDEDSYYGEVRLEVGGIAGINKGSISNCVSAGVTFEASQSNGVYKYTEGLTTIVAAPNTNRIDLGGIVGLNTDSGYIIDSTSYGNIVQKMYIKSVSGYSKASMGDPVKYLCTAYFNCGSFVGYSSGAVNRCVSQGFGWANPIWEPETEKWTFMAGSEDISDQVKNFNAYIGVETKDSGDHYYTGVPTDYRELMESYGWDFSKAPYKATAPAGIWSIEAVRLPSKLYYNLGAELNLAGLLLKDQSGRVIAGNYTVSGFNSGEYGRNTVTIEYMGVKTTVDLEIICSHRSLEFCDIDGTNDSEINCTVCGEQVMLLEAAQLAAEVVHTHKHAEDAVPNVTRPATHTEKGEQEYTCIECGEVFAESIPMTEAHEFPDEWEQHNGKYHKRTCPCGEVEYAEHEFPDEWTPYNDTQHSRACSCGEVEYADHVHGAVEDYSSTQHKSTCVCGRIDYLAHTMRAWENYSDTHHRRSCACGREEFAEHQFGNWVYVDSGKHMHSCTCGATEEEIHIASSSSVTKDPSHFEEGETTYTFSCCGGSYTEPIAKTAEHVYTDEWSYHTKDQHKRVCACGAAEAVEYDDHSYVAKETKPASHLEEGEMTYTCSGCGHSYVESIPKNDKHAFSAWGYFSKSQHKRSCPCGETEYASHTWDDGEVTRHATHTVEGETTFTCGDCNGTKTEPIAKTPNHEYGKWIYFDRKEHKRVCPCGEDNLYAEHHWSDGEVTKKPTHLEEGELTYVCGDCDGTKTDPIPKLEGHTFDKQVAEARFLKTGATCTSKAVYFLSCECGERGEGTFEEGEPLPHTPGGAYFHDGFSHWQLCTVCGAVTPSVPHAFANPVILVKPTEESEGSRELTCPCGEKTVETIAKLEHNYTVEVVPPTCSAGGYTKHTCLNCGDVYNTDELPAVEHTYDDRDDLECNECGFVRETPPMTAGDIILLIIGGLVFLSGCFCFYWFVIRD